MVGYIISGILLLILAAVLIRRFFETKRLKDLSEQMEDYLSGQYAALGYHGRKALPACAG